MRNKKTIVSISRAKTITNYIITVDCPQTNEKIYDVIVFGDEVPGIMAEIYHDLGEYR